MWLDRLSGHSTSSNAPQSQSRSFSPLPRRLGHLAPSTAPKRPGLSPQSSTLSLISNDSTSSLLDGTKKTNGSGLRQSTTVTDYPEPIEVLQRLLGAGGKGVDTASVSENGIDDFSLEEELEFSGLSLRELAELQDSESENIQSYVPQTVEEYERDKVKFEDLHRSIRACDDVLNSVEINLTKFQNDLGTVSAEIETLQARSTALSIRLENRKVVEKGLGPTVEEITVSPAVVRKISEGIIDEAWVQALAELEKRFKALDLNAKGQRRVKGVNDLRPLLNSLINKALERIRDFLAAQIKALRSPSINAQIIQQQHFLRFKNLYAFLSKHHETLADEIGQAYMNTMRWYFLDQFTRYMKSLEKLKLHVLDKYDLLGQDDGSRKTNILSSSKATGPSHDAFNLGRRIDLLKTSNQTALASYLAEEDKSYHYLEYPFRNFNLALVDNASAEYSFLTSFFAPSVPLSAISRNFNYIFEPTFNLGRTLTRSLVDETVDCLGVLMCVRLNQHFAFELQRRKVPAVDGYINGTNMLLWPRFQVIMDLHCESIRKSASSLSLQPPSSKAEQSKQSAAPHFLTQRFGQFLQGIIALSEEAGDDEPLSTSLGRLRSDVEAFLLKLSKSIGDSRKRERFLYNNYSLILTIVGDLDGKLAIEQREHFESLKMAFAGGS